MELPEEENLQLAPRVPPVPRRQNAVQVGVAEVEAPPIPLFCVVRMQFWEQLVHL